uniref:Protein C9orf114 n=1 Tax=Rhizophora mucronata TaxID=61149 RepID=A0A2P2L445_RHIMU
MGKRKSAEAEAEAARAQNDLEAERDLDNGDSLHIKKKNRKKEKRKERNEKEKDENKAKEVTTVSIAVPASIVDNAQSLELATRLAGQVARASTIFRVDEVVVFDNKSSSVDEDPTVVTTSSGDENESGAAFLMRILRYLETPQYLRKALFPKHNSLRFVGMLPPLDAPHHLRKHEWAPFREGVTLKEKAPKSGGTLVDVGLTKVMYIEVFSICGHFLVLN